MSIEEGLSVEEAISDFPLEGFDELASIDLELRLDNNAIKYDEWKDIKILGQ